MELPEIVECTGLVWVLGIELRFSERAVCAVSCQTLSSAPLLSYWFSIALESALDLGLTFLHQIQGFINLKVVFCHHFFLVFQ